LIATIKKSEIPQVTNKRPFDGLRTPLPTIGITCLNDQPTQDQHPPRFGQNQAYVHAVARAGAAPLLIPQLTDKTLLRTLYELLDGLLLSGGEDVDPARYGEPRHEKCGPVSPDRDEIEFTLTRWALDDEKPLLAICRGIQVLNVALGGSLYQDIQTQVQGADKHDRRPDYPRNHLSHPVLSAACPELVLSPVEGLVPSPSTEFILSEVEGLSIKGVEGQSRRVEGTAIVTPQTRLAHILGPLNSPRPLYWVNSMHHQAIKDVAPGLTVAARAPDGIVEAVEAEGHPFAIGVQWHPEELADNDVRSQRIFDALVEACQGRMKNGG
jgi:putative glutamine amidotransferase